MPKPRFYTAMAVYGLLALASGFTLTGKLRLATWIFLAGLAVKTYIHYLSEP